MRILATTLQEVVRGRRIGKDEDEGKAKKDVKREEAEIEAVRCDAQTSVVALNSPTPAPYQQYC